MKRFLLALSVVCISGSSALAWVGGPYSNDSADSNGADGLHSAVMRGTNLMGVLQMPIGLAATGVGGIVTFVAEGNIAAGEVLGVADFPRRLISGVMSTRTSATFEVVNQDSDFVEASVLEIPGSSAPGSFEAKITQTREALLWEGEGTIANFISEAVTDPDTGEEVVPETIPFTITGLRTSLVIPEVAADPFTSFLTSIEE